MDFVEEMEEYSKRLIAEAVTEPQTEEDYYRCGNCSTPFRWRSGFFFCKGCGKIVNIDEINKKIRAKRKSEELSVDDIFAQMNKPKVSKQGKLF